MPISSRSMTAARLGNYELLLELAAGGMATVYVARHDGVAGFERLVVVKRVHPHLVKDRAFTDMLRDEARMSSTIRHPNVVPVIDVIETDDELLLVLEYVESLPLSALLQLGRLPPAVVSSIVGDALAGLHAAHEAVDLRGDRLDLIHRDVSPQNIIVGVEGVSRLIDFGVAKAKSRITTTTDGEVKGKVRYMSPEQVRQQPLDRRADIFAAGVVLYEALTGERPFPGTDIGDIALGILMGELPPPSSIVPSLPPEVDAVLERALARDRGERYATAAELQDALEHAVPAASPREVATVVETVGQEQLERHRTNLRAALARASSDRTAIAVVKSTADDARPTSRRGTVALAAALGCAIAAGTFATMLLRRGAHVAQAASSSSAPAESASASAPPQAPTEAAASVSMPTLDAHPQPSAPSPPARPARRPDRTRPASSTDLHRRNPYGAP
jgi:serine/threonine-protein kinase